MSMLNIDLIVIAGGASRRMGVDKALLPVPPHDLALIRHLIERLSDLVTGKTIVVANDTALSIKAKLPDSVAQIPDDYPGGGALGGLATGLARCEGWAIAVACDLPLVNPDVFSLLADHIESTAGQTWDAIVPKTEGYPQPLHALYHRRCLPAMQVALEADQLRIISFYRAVRVHYVEEAELQRIDPNLRSFVNVNTPADWQTVLGEFD